MKPSRAFVRVARRGCCASPMPWMISSRQPLRARSRSAPPSRSAGPLANGELVRAAGSPGRRRGRRVRCDSRRSRLPDPPNAARPRAQPGFQSLRRECGRPIRPLASRQRRTPFGRMARAHPVSAVVIELASEEGMIVGQRRPPRLRLAFELLLDRSHISVGTPARLLPSAILRPVHDGDDRHLAPFVVGLDCGS